MATNEELATVKLEMQALQEKSLKLSSNLTSLELEHSECNRTRAMLEVEAFESREQIENYK